MANEKTINYLRERLSTLAIKAKSLKLKMTTSKTTLRRDYYGKKLKKINRQALDVLLILNAAGQLQKPDEPVTEPSETLPDEQ